MHESDILLRLQNSITHVFVPTCATIRCYYTSIHTQSGKHEITANKENSKLLLSNE
jgi:hypothetical protein